jgi:hypothetical protein
LVRGAPSKTTSQAALAVERVIDAVQSSPSGAPISSRIERRPCSISGLPTDNRLMLIDI